MRRPSLQTPVPKASLDPERDVTLARTFTRLALAAGIFLGVGLFVILDGVTHPFFQQFRTRPLILMCIEFLVGALLLLATSRSVAHRLPAVPPPPS